MLRGLFQSPFSKALQELGYPCLTKCHLDFDALTQPENHLTILISCEPWHTLLWAMTLHHDIASAASVFLSPGTWTCHPVTPAEIHTYQQQEPEGPPVEPLGCPEARHSDGPCCSKAAERSPETLVFVALHSHQFHIPAIGTSSVLSSSQLLLT